MPESKNPMSVDRRSYGAAHFITYSNGVSPFAENAEDYCRAALECGFATAHHVTEDTLRATPFWEENKGVLEQRRGAGFWLWKPYIIRQRLAEIGQDDLLVYADAGRYKPGSFRQFPRFPHTYFQAVALSPKRFIVGFITEWMRQAPYTKADCFALMDADNAAMLHAPQIGASQAAFMPGADAFSFLDEWLEYAKDPRILTDMPDEVAPSHWDFTDHRHDQAIASILVHRSRGHYVDLSKNGLMRFKKSVDRLYPGSPRIPAHPGYMSEIIRLALTDRACDPDTPLDAFEGIVANVKPDAPIPYRARVASLDYLRDLGLSKLRERWVPDPDEIQAIISSIWIANQQLRQFPELLSIGETAVFWESVQSTLSETVTNIPKDASTAELTEITTNAYLAELDRNVDLRRALGVSLSYAVMDHENRKVLKSLEKTLDRDAGREILTDIAQQVPDLTPTDFATLRSVERANVMGQIAHIMSSPPRLDTKAGQMRLKALLSENLLIALQINLFLSLRPEDEPHFWSDLQEKIATRLSSFSSAIDTEAFTKTAVTVCLEHLCAHSDVHKALIARTVFMLADWDTRQIILEKFRGRDDPAAIEFMAQVAENLPALAGNDVGACLTAERADLTAAIKDAIVHNRDDVQNTPEARRGA